MAPAARERGISSFRSPCATTLLAVWVAMAGSDRALMLALPALAVLAAFALPTLKRSAAAAIDWFSVFFFTIAVADRLGLLRRDADRRAGQAGDQRRQAVARLSATFLAARPRARARRDRRLALAGALAHRPQPPSVLEEPRPAGRRRQRLLAARDDPAPAAARQRAQLSLDDAAHRAAGPGRRLHRRAGHGARRRSSRSSTSAAIASTR